MPQVKHIGVFQFRESVSQAEIDECFAALSSMQGRIPGLVDFIHGPYASDEGLNDGFTHGFIMTFEDAAARDAYLPHPVHEEVKEVVVPRLERLVVFDFEV